MIAVEELGPRSSLGDAAPRITALRLDEVRRFEERLARQRDPDTVHDMRVAARRLRGALTLFAGRGPLAALEREVKRLQDALGGVRDVHVRREWLDERTRTAKSDGERAAIERFRGENEQQLPTLDRALLDALARWRDEVAPSLAARIAAFDGAAPSGRLGGARMRQALARRLTRVARRAARAHRSLDAAAAHALRIAVKKVRYQAELIAPALPSTAAAIEAVLDPLQKGAGNLHDMDVAIDRVRAHADRDAGDAADGMLALLSGLEKQRERQAADLALAIDRLRAERILDLLRGLLLG
jgi:CHAD domain-containing protein